LDTAWLPIDGTLTATASPDVADRRAAKITLIV